MALSTSLALPPSPSPFLPRPYSLSLPLPLSLSLSPSLSPSPSPSMFFTYEQHDLDIISNSFQCYLNVLFRNKHQYSNFVVAPNTGVQNQG